MRSFHHSIIFPVSIAFLTLMTSCSKSKRLQEPDAAPKPTVDQAHLSEKARKSLHDDWDQLLRKYVADGVVNYDGFQKDEAILDRYLQKLEQTNPASLPEKERLALWINAYNAFTVKLILSRYPKIESIKEIPRRWKNEDWTVGGVKYSLGGIEHEILRKKFNEPRIHFAIVCASLSCPDLASEAYVADRIDAQLDHAAKNFLANDLKGFKTITKSGFFGTDHYVYFSKIFSWFGEDFEKSKGSAVQFVRPYISEDLKKFLDTHKDDLSIRYFSYDWSLNNRKLSK